jgi:hypothetical protein
VYHLLLYVSTLNAFIVCDTCSEQWLRVLLHILCTVYLDISFGLIILTMKSVTVISIIMGWVIYSHLKYETHKYLYIIICMCIHT